MLDRIRANLTTMAISLGGAIRKHAHPKHHAALDSYRRFIEFLINHLTLLEKRMTDISKSLLKVEGERDQWKTYAQAQKTKADQADRARQAAEDKLAAIPLQGDAEDAANVNGVLTAADDLPPTEPAVADTVAGGGGEVAPVG